MKTFKVEKKYKDLMEKWIQDLYKNPELQGKEYLYNGEGEYCCLGRLCIVAGYKDDDIADEGEIPLDYDAVPKTFVEGNSAVLIAMNDSEYMPDTQREEWGLDNERRQYTFPEIAEFLEKHIEYAEEV